MGCIVVADMGTDQHALARAQDIVRATGALIELVGFVYDSAVADNPQLAARDRRLATRRLAEWLCANVRPLGGDLVVKTNHPSGRPWYVPSDWYLMRELSVPLLLVNADAPRGGRGAVATQNAGARSARARAIDRSVLTAAGWWARTFGGPAHAAYVHEVPPLPLDLGIVKRRGYLRRQERIARERLASRLRARPRGVAFRGHTVLGRPERVLPKLVRTLRPAVTVMGTAARTGLPRFFVGSTAEAVIPVLGTDVLVVKPGGRR